ncbi:MAG TPA: hypothetical protein VM076_11090 [Gemmatimonadaceae bacterium]|nr:hypothetical protein [Gemmatimonadaceae bacterium]
MRRTPHVLAAAALLFALPAAAQAPLKTLTKPDAEYAEPFTQINGVRELRDGRVVVSDVREKTVQLVDFKAGTATKIGREGSGPGEYAMPLALLAIPGDTSLLYDPLNRRFLLIGPDGKAGKFAQYEDDGAGPIRISRVRYTDTRGRLYSAGAGFSFGANGAPTSSDSAPILRLDRATKKADTVAYIKIAPVSVSTSGGGQNVAVRAGGGNPFVSTDDWAVTPDGRVAIIRTKDYHVDWYAPNGQKISGPAIAYEKVRVTDDDKKAFRERRANGAGVSIAFGQRVGPGGVTQGANVPPPTNIQLPEPTDWPDVKPAFTGNAAFAAPNGQVWVLRTRAAKDKIPTFDVFDQTGRVVSRVALPAETRLIGFGNGTVYVARSDEDDLQYLQRYRLP